MVSSRVNPPRKNGAQIERNSAFCRADILIRRIFSKQFLSRSALCDEAISLSDEIGHLGNDASACKVRMRLKIHERLKLREFVGRISLSAESLGKPFHHRQVRIPALHRRL